MYLNSYSRNSDFFYGVRTWLRALERKTKFWVCGISVSIAGQRVQIRIKGHASQVLWLPQAFFKSSRGLPARVSATLIYTHVNLSPNRRPANPVYNQSSESTVDLWFSEFDKTGPEKSNFRGVHHEQSPLKDLQVVKIGQNPSWHIGKSDSAIWTPTWPWYHWKALVTLILAVCHTLDFRQLTWLPQSPQSHVSSLILKNLGLDFSEFVVVLEIL